MRKGSVSLGEVATRASHINVACSRCDRKGRYRLVKLVDQFVKDFAMTDLGADLAVCPRRNATAHHERCDVYFPGSRRLMSDDDATESLFPPSFHPQCSTPILRFAVTWSRKGRDIAMTSASPA